MKTLKEKLFNGLSGVLTGVLSASLSVASAAPMTEREAKLVENLESLEMLTDSTFLPEQELSGDKVKPDQQKAIQQVQGCGETQQAALGAALQRPGISELAKALKIVSMRIGLSVEKLSYSQVLNDESFKNMTAGDKAFVLKFYKWNEAAQVLRGSDLRIAMLSAKQQNVLILLPEVSQQLVCHVVSQDEIIQGLRDIAAYHKVTVPTAPVAVPSTGGSGYVNRYEYGDDTAPPIQSTYESGMTRRQVAIVSATAAFIGGSIALSLMRKSRR